MVLIQPIPQGQGVLDTTRLCSYWILACWYHYFLYKYHFGWSNQKFL